MRLKTPEERLAFAIDRAYEHRHARRQYVRRLVMLVVTMVAATVLGGILSGCPKPPPDPVTPPDAPPASCEEACAHVELQPPDGLGCATEGGCGEICRRVLRASYRACLRDARDCAAVTACGK